MRQPDTEMLGYPSGKLTVVEIIPGDGRIHPRYKCLCECGNTRVFTRGDLRSKKYRSCGCAKNSHLIDMTKWEYHDLKVIARDTDRTGKKECRWVCRCKCGNIKSFPGYVLRAGNRKDCGCKSQPKEKKKKSTPKGGDRFYEPGLCAGVALMSQDSYSIGSSTCGVCDNRRCIVSVVGV